MNRRRPVQRRAPFSRGSTELSRSPWHVDGVPGKHRRTPMPRQGDPAKAAAREERQYGDHADWIRTQPSLVSQRFGTARNPVMAAHAWHTRGAGGVAEDCVPLLKREERQIHRIGRRSFQQLHDVDLDAAAARYARHSPALHPEIARRVAVLSCLRCGARTGIAVILLPDDSYQAVCPDAACRAEMERAVAALVGAEVHHG